MSTSGRSVRGRVAATRVSQRDSAQHRNVVGEIGRELAENDINYFFTIIITKFLNLRSPINYIMLGVTTEKTCFLRLV